MPTSTFAAALLLIQPAPLPDVQIETVGDQAYRLTVPIEGETSPASAQAALQPTALRLCGPESYVFGRYSFSSSETTPASGDAAGVASVTLVQNVTCGMREAEPASGATPAPPLSEADLERLTPMIDGLTERYFSAVEEARHAESLAMTSEEMTGGASLAEWTRTRDQQRAEAGAPVSRQVARLTWYANPAGVTPGYYAAVDYVASWERRDECGYLIWFSPDGVIPFTLTRQQQTWLDHGLDDETHAAIRQQFCAIL